MKGGGGGGGGGGTSPSSHIEMDWPPNIVSHVIYRMLIIIITRIECVL